MGTFFIFMSSSKEILEIVINAKKKAFTKRRPLLAPVTFGLDLGTLVYFHVHCMAYPFARVVCFLCKKNAIVHLCNVHQKKKI